MKKNTFKTILLLTLCITSFMTSAQNVIHYQDFQYFTNSGFTAFATSNPDGETLTANSGNAFVTRKTGASDIASETTLGYTRPATTIPDGGTRTATSVKMSGNYGNDNLNGTVWVVTDAIDISGQNNMTVSFATKNAFKEGGGTNTFQVLIAKNYTDGTSPDDGSLSWIDVTSSIVDSNNDGKIFGNDGSFAYTTIDLSSYIADEGSDKFVVAFKYTFTDAGDYNDPIQPIRNGAWWISDVRYYSTPVDVANGAFSALNTSFSGQTNIFNTPSAVISNDNFSNTGAWAEVLTATTSVPRLVNGTETPLNEGYLFEVSAAYNPILVTEIRHKLANATSTKGATGDSQWMVQASNDASTWDNVSSVITVPSNANDERTTTLTTTQTYRYYRFVLSSAWTASQNFTALQELDFTVDDSVLSNNKNTSETAIILYPNPTNNLLHIQNNNNDAIVSVSLIDLTGRIITHKTDTSTIDVSAYTKGIYLVNITLESGISTTTKIVVN
ncbi:T9SS type A sorting domain-containing protein [Flavicella sediminum]|uniref:T9SS type A sorting domain-containing protein n=1 Tax=Flavicella sediminum TaxID=2585141 RepID=UPI001120F9E4|nr:T9SS type A sorting domain-containing protein [Flavicella sediminum]